MELLKNNPKLWLSKFPWKTKSSNKYSRGRVLILGAQKNMIGATILAAESCLRVGVGSVKIICSQETLPILSHKFPSALKIEINNFLRKLILNHEPLMIDLIPEKIRMIRNNPSFE